MNLALQLFFNDQKVTISNTELNEAIEEFTNQITSQTGCSCCGIVYPSLKEYLEENLLTKIEFRKKIKVDLAIQKYLEATWNAAHASSELKQKLLANETVQKIKENCFSLSHIAFYAYQQAGCFAVDINYRRARRKADEAMDLIRTGVPFSEVAQKLSEDRLTRNKGGVLGCIPKSSLLLAGNLVKTIEKMDYGTPPQLIEGNDGFHIFIRTEFTDELILQFERARDVALKKKGLIDDVLKNTSIEKIDTP